jgi:hypothetical protein
MPVRVWLRTQWMLSQFGSVDNKLFGKLPVDEENVFDESAPSTSTKKSKSKRKHKQKKGKRSSPEPSRLETNLEGTQQATEEQPETTEVTEISEVFETPDPVAASEIQDTSEELASDISVASSKVVPHPEPETKGSPKMMESEDQQAELVVWKRQQKQTSGSAGASEEGHAPQLTDRRGYLLKGVQTNFPYKGVPTEQQLAAVAGQNTVTASLSPQTPVSLSISATSFGTARSSLSPSVPLPSSSPVQFFTPMSSPAEKKESDDEMGAQRSECKQANTLGELGPIVEEQEEVEVEIRYPVPKRGDELYLSGKFPRHRYPRRSSSLLTFELDPEEYTRECMEVVTKLPRRRSFNRAFEMGMYVITSYNNLSVPKLTMSQGSSSIRERQSRLPRPTLHRPPAPSVTGSRQTMPSL